MKSYHCIRCDKTKDKPLVNSLIMCTCRDIHLGEVCLECFYNFQHKVWVYPLCSKIPTSLQQQTITEVGKTNPIDIIYPDRYSSIDLSKL